MLAQHWEESTTKAEKGARQVDFVLKMMPTRTAICGSTLMSITTADRSISYPESSGFLVSGATPGRLWGHQILLPQDFCGKTMETVTEQPIKKIEFFRCPQSLPGVAPLTKKPEDSGYEIADRLAQLVECRTTVREVARSNPGRTTTQGL